MTARFKFQDRFFDAVRDAKKLHTIRKARKRLPRPGDKVVLEYWTGKPYGSPVGIIGESTLTDVVPVVVSGTPDDQTWIVGGERLDKAAIEALAVADGFPDVQGLIDFFRPAIPFVGHLYKWTKPTPPKQ